ncbi:hypothetical protein J4440_01175 [Candidatus Woesearchaeota archaeon]|nr:hypothetical protein [Candidatus Woesearchaeota archaeon]
MRKIFYLFLFSIFLSGLIGCQNRLDGTVENQNIDDSTNNLETENVLDKDVAELDKLNSDLEDPSLNNLEEDLDLGDDF